jgi:hypothetical protein
VQEKFEEFFGDFLILKVCYEGMKVCDVALCTSFRL